MIRALLLPLLIAVTPTWADDALDTKALASLPNAATPAPNLVTAGDVRAQDVALIGHAGIRHVIDLRVDGETPDFDEAVAVRAAGMQYHNLPIRGAEDLTRENADRFDRLLAEVGAAPTLVHCARRNRVGALAALRAAWVQGQSVDTALAEGRRWGLKGLEPAVRERLEASGSAPTMPGVMPTGTLQFPRIEGAGGVYALPAGADMPAAGVVQRLLIDAHALVAQLPRAGVEIFVCRQALGHQGHAVADVRDNVRVSLSAMTKLVARRYLPNGAG